MSINTEHDNKGKFTRQSITVRERTKKLTPKTTNSTMYNLCTCFNDVLLLDAFKEHTNSEIKKAFHKTSLMLHPDKWSDEKATEYMQVINKAQQVLISINNNRANTDEEMTDHDCDLFIEVENTLKTMINERSPQETNNYETENKSIFTENMDDDDYPILAQKIPKREVRKSKQGRESRRDSLKNLKPPPGKKIEKIISHIVHNKGLKFQIKWTGVKIILDGPLRFVLDYPDQLVEYMVRIKKESIRKHNFLVRTYPEILDAIRNSWAK